MNIINSVSRSASRLNREKLVAFVRLGRPKFLLYSLLLFSLGATIAAHDGSGLDLRGYLVGQLFVWTGKAAQGATPKCV